MSERMRHLKTAAIAVTLFLCCAVSSFGANAVEFYLDLLEKGIGQYNAAAYPEAATLLRTAAFGLLESTDRYQTAQIYRAIVADKLEDATTAREATRRVLAAERVQKTYAALSIPAAVRTSFEAVAKKTLAASEMAMLKSTAQLPPAQQQATPQQTPPKPEQKAEQKPEPKPEQKAEQKPEQKPEPKPERKSESKPPQQTPPKPEQKAERKLEPKPAPPPVTTPPATAQPARDIASQLTSADRALSTGNLSEARRLYRQSLDGTPTHEQAIRIAEGLYRARDFPSVLRAFDRAGALRRGEESYRFYLAVAYYETGRFAAAKKELAAALNFIEMTPDVAQYREKIEGAAD